MATVAGAQATMPRRSNALGVHSLQRFVFSVPDLAPAEAFYRTFGLDVRRDGNRLDLYTHGHPHCWGSVHANGAPKRLQYLSFAAYPDDMDALTQRLRTAGAAEPHPLSDGAGVWTRDADGTLIQVVVGPKVSPSNKAQTAPGPATPPGKGAAPSRRAAAAVHPRRLSHVLLFSPDVPRQVAFYERVLGLRLSDRSGDIIAFLHGPHASDHHMVAFAKSGVPGLHHSSWDVGHFNDVGLGAERMKESGYTHGWGVGRHVLGSNYFYYVQDPWGSWAEYSYDIDFVPADVTWPAADHPPEDSFYIWGPTVPDDFIVNHEQPQAA
jgi:catechol 2,3-dioxygenase-like lactoylglutathione lyase family enzyme